MADIRYPSAFRTIATFCALGPPIGGAVLYAVTWIFVGGGHDSWTFFLLLVAMLAYPAGIVPALLVGFATWLLAKVLNPPWLLIPVAGLIGALTIAAGILSASGLAAPTHGSLVWSYVLVGAVPGLACAALCLPTRPRQVAPARSPAAG